MRKWLGFAAAALALGFSIWAFPRLPESVATHFNFKGEPDGYSSRMFGAFMIPGIMLALRVIAQVFPRIDPKSPNYERFLGTYWLLINSILWFLAATHIVVLGYALGWPVSVQRVMPVGIGALFIVIGNYLGRVEPNWFMGVRTPWTLSSDKVWRRTNRTAGWLFVVAGCVLMLGVFAPPSMFFPVLMGTIVVVAVIPIVQSYVLWKREQAVNG